MKSLFTDQTNQTRQTIKIPGFKLFTDLLTLLDTQGDLRKLDPKAYLDHPAVKGEVFPAVSKSNVLQPSNDKLKIETLLCSTKLTQNGTHYVVRGLLRTRSLRHHYVVDCCIVTTLTLYKETKENWMLSSANILHWWWCDPIDYLWIAFVSLYEWSLWAILQEGHFWLAG